MRLDEYRQISNQAMDLRIRLGVDATSPVDVFSLASTIDKLTLVKYAFNGNISGACMKFPLSNLIVVNTTQSLGRQRFTLGHELYHLFYDQTQGNIICAGAIGKGNPIERKADLFASLFLVPTAALHSAMVKLGTASRITMLDVLKLEQLFGISHQAMLIRLSDEGLITKDEQDNLSYGIVNYAMKKGYDTTLYEKNAQPESKVLGHYIDIADNLLSSSFISEGKYDELLLDAFRDDIVFGNYDMEGLCD